MINAALCRSKTNPGARGVPRAGSGAALSAGLSCAGGRQTAGGLVWPGTAFWGSPPRHRDGGCSLGCLRLPRLGSAAEARRVPQPVRLGAMLHAAGEPDAAARAHAGLSGRLGGQSPTILGPVCFLSRPCGFLPARARENVSATPERPRGPAAIPAGPT